MRVANAPAGPCEWCGGPQWWTVAHGDMYVKCKAGCMSMFPEERVDFPPPDGEESEPYYEGGALDGTSQEEEGVPLEGGAAEDIGADLPF